MYILNADANKYQNLVLADEDDWEVIYRFNGKPLRSFWMPLSVKVLYDDDQNKNLPASDFPLLFSTLPVFSERAVKLLEPLLKGDGELLPLSCNEGNYVAFNVTRVVDALNAEQSDLVRFSDGKIMDIRRYVFDRDKLTNGDLFKIPQTPQGKVFVTDKFKEAVQEAGLTGYVFEPV